MELPWLSTWTVSPPLNSHWPNSHNLTKVAKFQSDDQLKLTQIETACSTPPCAHGARRLPEARTRKRSILDRTKQERPGCRTHHPGQAYHNKQPTTRGDAAMAMDQGSPHNVQTQQRTAPSTWARGGAQASRKTHPPIKIRSHTHTNQTTATTAATHNRKSAARGPALITRHAAGYSNNNPVIQAARTKESRGQKASPTKQNTVALS